MIHADNQAQQMRHDQTDEADQAGKSDARADCQRDQHDGYLFRALRVEPGNWTVRYFLHHLADADAVLYDRLKRVISEPKPLIWAFDESAWAEEPDYANLPLELSKRIYESVRDAIIYRARLHYESHGHLEFVHNETGVRTLKQEFDKVAAHNEHHLKQIKMALEAP